MRIYQFRGNKEEDEGVLGKMRRRVNLSLEVAIYQIVRMIVIE
jgi:hypothetical protein